MSLAFKAALPTIILAIAPLAALAQDSVAPSLPRVIQVVGEGRASAAPDMARLSLGVSHQAATAGEAMDAMSAGMEAVLGRLGSMEVNQADIQTGQLMLEPAYNYNTPDGNPEMVGFLATQMLDVKVREIAQLGEVLDAVVQDGANRVNGVTFDVADPQSANDDARRNAVANAQSRAEIYAEAAGVGLGELISISESTVYAPPMPLYDAYGSPMAEASSVPVAPGQMSVITNVTVTYAIE